MPHLGKFRIGWENEHLASFLLSRIAFVANPVTVADDVGLDFFCTLFEVSETNQLFPRNSFAIQVKGSEGPVNFSGKIEYLEKLELPFFVGVVDQDNLRLSIYSGEYVPFLFAEFGRPGQLTLLLEDGGIVGPYCEQRPNNDCVLRMPHVADIDAHEGRRSASEKAQRLLTLCSRMHQNISSKMMDEYLFKLGDGRPVIFAGPRSVLTFRHNFYDRLAEVFRNLDWLYERRPLQFSRVEYEVYERCYLDLKKTAQIPMELSAAYQRLKQRLTANNGFPTPQP